MTRYSSKVRAFLLLVIVAVAPSALAGDRLNSSSGNDAFSSLCLSQSPGGSNGRVVCADIAALDQTLVYNRFGSFNPFGMMFALRRDLSPLYDGSVPVRLGADDCSKFTGTESGQTNQVLEAGKVRLKDCERPRPMTLRVNVGDTLLVRVSNLLHTPTSDQLPAPSDVQSPAPDFSKDFCEQDDLQGIESQLVQDLYRREVRKAVSTGSDDLHRHGEVSCRNRPESEHGAEEPQEGDTPVEPIATDSDWPNTRALNFVVQGLTPLPDPVSNRVNGACLGTAAVAPNESFYCRYRIDQEGTYFLASPAAPAGGEGDGGSIVHGLFGAIIAQRQGSRWYRSQVTNKAFDLVWPARRDDGAPRHSRTGLPDYETTDRHGVPILNMAMPIDGTSQENFDDARAVELIHDDLNAIVFCSDEATGNDCRALASVDPTRTEEPAYRAFREFSVFFHDELKTFYTRHFEDVASLGQMAGVKDGFALNYGASGMGTILMANRKGIGPSADCMECLYEEFFLTSWANGDPALLERFADDPSNVHHSYLNDPVVFRNFHAGPKETHVFHLHAHQWFSGNDPSRGGYLDSQTVAPQQGFSYNIYHGGRRDYNDHNPGKQTDGWWDTQGSGNRNRTLGDSIFHCHLYPHFAQGMWALWRVHDVLEDGTRKMPDGQSHDRLSTGFAEVGADGHKRAGSVNRLTGEWHQEQRGTPVPAIVPLPGEPLPLLPTYLEPGVEGTPMPGFPFYIAGEAGHRPPQAPLDIAKNIGQATANNTQQDSESGADIDQRPVLDEDGHIVLNEDENEWLDGGIGRHVIKDGSTRELGIRLPDIDPESITDDDRRGALMSQIVAKSFALGDMSAHLDLANIELLDNAGTTLERGAMGFHFNGKPYSTEQESDAGELILRDAQGKTTSFVNGSYASPVSKPPSGSAVRLEQFAVNGSAPKPGAPFADPCSAPLASPDKDDSTGILQPRKPLTDDPLFRGQGAATEYATDPMLWGFRRYEVSAVQLDLIVNQAGWHDPQARINVLTAHSDDYKDGSQEASKRISPTISDSEEPFFFRALSGECIEFRHTNELPKELELDDFQVKTPTDTIGQHIHLVKFDVTASDGSGNGWNYEDGTFAADELAARRCAGLEGTITGLNDGTFRTPVDDECKAGVPKEKDIWRLPLTGTNGSSPVKKLQGQKNREKFQTTVQRWFADPIISRDENRVDRDRTLRTVFTHDHFGPSSIQQHGFYSALVIEPGQEEPDSQGNTRSSLSALCEEDQSTCLLPRENSWTINDVAWSGDVMVGSRKLVKTASDPIHPDYREFALSIADFALLYDPRDRLSKKEFMAGLEQQDQKGPVVAQGRQGMHQLYCEGRQRLMPLALKACGNHPLKDKDNGSWYFEGEIPPAWIAGGANRDDIHKSRFHGDLLGPLVGGPSEVSALRDHAIAWRQKAAGMFGKRLGDDVPTLAKPVAPPLRPESISVDHHDPYLVNYRGAPFPLRIGDKLDLPAVLDSEQATLQSEDCKPLQISLAGNRSAEKDSDVVKALQNGSFSECSIKRQIAGQKGDMAGVMQSLIHGDPETPIFEAYQGERLAFRLIQGAQEVQHTFNVAGQPFKRNIDQAFSQGMQPLGASAAARANPTLRQQCFEAMRNGRPSEYKDWRDTAPDIFTRIPDSPSDDFLKSRKHFKELEHLLATCDNIEGFAFAQEIGISEHFEMQGSLRSDVRASAESVMLNQQPVIAVPSGEPASEATDVADYLYNFGSVDAMWNGAWGLVRIYDNPQTIDPATLSSASNHLKGAESEGAQSAQNTSEGKPISDRLGDFVLNSRGSNESTGAAAESGVPVGGLSCPLPGDENTRHTEAVIVALETRKVWPSRGTDYGGPRYDPDGLMLALLDPEAVVDKGFRASEDAWQSLDETRVLSAITSDGRYTDGPRPFTLRVNAGDCVRLRIVNLLEEDGTQEGLRDLLGDARLPPIVSLNADPAYAGVSFEDSTEASGGLQRVGSLERPEHGGSPGGVRPSASLALSIGLPGLDLIRNIPLAYGYNKAALKPMDERIAVSPELRFFAGRYRLDVKTDDDVARMYEAVEATLEEHILSVSGGWLKGGGNPFPAAGIGQADVQSILTIRPTESVRCGVSGGSLFKLLGKSYKACFETQEIPQFSATSESNAQLQSLTLDDSDASAAALVERYCTAAADFVQCEVNVMSALETFVAVARTEALRVLNNRTHWIPYAFGLVPIKSTSDMISHATHGLFGAIDVLPEHWELDKQHGVTKTETIGKVQYRSISYKETGQDGHPAVFQVPSAIGSPPNVTSKNVLRGAESGVIRSSSDKLVSTGFPADTGTRVREFVLYYQDGLNLHDENSSISWQWDDDQAIIKTGGSPLKMVPECPVCDDSYDRGDYAVNYRSAAFSQVLREQLPEDQKIDGSVEASDDLNVYQFPPDYLAKADNALRLEACEGEQIVVRVMHPGGRARQRAFVVNGYSYEDLFPGFGFPRSALLAPGKSVSAWLTPLATPGVSVWHDGPTQIRSGGVWGLLDVASADAERCRI